MSRKDRKKDSVMITKKEGIQKKIVCAVLALRGNLARNYLQDLHHQQNNPRGSAGNTFQSSPLGPAHSLCPLTGKQL